MRLLGNALLRVNSFEIICGLLYIAWFNLPFMFLN